MKPTSKKMKKAAKRLFPRKPHNTRAFSSEDYKALPIGDPAK
jgi:hypothetical protein